MSQIVDDETTTDPNIADESAASSSDQHPDDPETDASGATDRSGSEARRRAIPLDRHEDILRGTRREYEERLGWADGLDQRRVNRALQVLDDLDADPNGFIDRLSTRFSRTGPPEPNLKTEDGRMLYDAEQAAKLVDYHIQRAIAKLESRFGSVEAQIATADAQANAAAQITEAANWPGFNDHLDDILEVVESAQRRGRPITLERAYIQAVVPNLGKTARRKVVDEITDKARAGGDDRPSRQPSRRPVPDTDRSIAELFEEELSKRR